MHPSGSILFLRPVLLLSVPASLLLMTVSVVQCGPGAVYFKPASEYRYSFTGYTSIDDVKKFEVDAKISIIHLGQLRNYQQHCELKVHYYFVHTEVDGSNRRINTQDLDFNKWCSFYINQHGQITKVIASNDEDSYVLAMKKIILGALSSRLIVSESQQNEGKRWGYKAEEIGHEGLHNSTYQAVPNGDVISFSKQKHTAPAPGSYHKYRKDIHFNTKSGVPEKSEIDEAFATPKSVPPGYKTIVPGARDELLQGDKQIAMPTMGGNSTMKLVLDSVLTNDDFLYRISDKPQNVSESTLKIEKISETPIPLRISRDWIEGNLTCTVQAKIKHDNKTMMKCFSELQLNLERLTTEDLINVKEMYKATQPKRPKVWNLFLSALGAVQSNVSLEILLNYTILKPDATPEVLMNAMVHFAGLQDCPSKIILETFENRVLQKPWYFNDSEQTGLVNERAVLVLGSLVSSVYQCNPIWADKITREIQTMLGVHDPFNHREARSTMEQHEFTQYVNKKALHILTLGNGKQDSSLKYFESFLNTSESHLHLRCSAVEAISKYQHLPAAEMLLKAIITDEDETVRRNAREAYERHIHGGSLEEFVQTLRFPNMTTDKHELMKRSLKDTIGRIWKGFEFHLETPSFSWIKIVGGAMLGASMGVVFHNELDISIKPLASHGKVDVHDAAWATIHIGLIGFDFDIFRAELCFKGEIGYNLNVLAEYVHGQIEKFAGKYFKVIKKVVKTIKKAIEQFKTLVNIWKDFDIGEIFDRFIKALRDMPKKVFDLKKIVRRIMQILDQYVDLPPVIEMIKTFVNDVKSLFTDIKTDVMRLYHSINDMIKTTLPWAWKEIKEAFNGIIDAFKSIMKNPTKVMQKMGRSIARISTAIGVVLEAKNKIVEANIFAKDQRPYWFDIKTVFNNLKNQVVEISKAVGKITDGLFDIDEGENKEAIAFTGVDLKTMTKNTLKEIWEDIKTEFMAGPVQEIENLLSPFIQTYEFFTTTVKNLKEAWTIIVNAFKSAKTEQELIFGFKIHGKFPNEYLESFTCGDGFWKSTGKGRYKYPGISLSVTGNQIVSPANGIIKQTGWSQVTIEVFEMDETEIILHNVKLNHGLHGEEVEGGSVIGTIVKPIWCLDKHVHLSMRRIGGDDFVDPTKYLEKRPVPPVTWVLKCGFYVLRWKGRTLSYGSLTKEKEDVDETPSLPAAPSASDIEVDPLSSPGSSSGRKKRFLDQWVDNLKDFASSLGLPKMDNLKDVFKLNTYNITLENLLKFLDKYQLSDLKHKIDHHLQAIQTFKNKQSCQRPSSMTDEELKYALSISGKSAVGARKTLEKRYFESQEACYSIRNTIGKNNWCQFDSTCLSVSCCMDLKFFKLLYTLHAFVTLDPCSQTLTFGLNSWSKAIPFSIEDFAIEGDQPLVNDENMLDIAQLIIYYKIQKYGNVFKVSISVRFCSTYEETVCKDLHIIVKEAQFIKIPCTAATTGTSRGKRSLMGHYGSISNEMQGFLNMEVGEFLKVIDFIGLDENEIEELIETISDAFSEWLIRKIESVVASIFGNQFSSRDECLIGYERTFGPYNVPIYKLRPPWLIPLGPIPCTFQFGINGYYGAKFRADFCLLSMKAQATVLPQIGSVAWGYYGLSVGPSSFRFTAQVRLIGYLLTTSFPTKLEATFSKFPIKVKSRMDLVLIPLRIELRLFLKLEIRISLPWGKKITWSWTLINYLLWHYQSRTITKNIFNKGDPAEDKSAPVFEKYPARSESQSMSSSNSIPQCTVYQIPNKDHTEPAFFLGIGVTDDRSNVEMTYCIGTYSGGCNVVNNEPLGGDSVVQSRHLYPGVILYVTVTARNSQSLPSTALCQMSTFDVTLPGGRVTPDFIVTSHPNILRASVFIADDTPVIQRQIAVGYGPYTYGNTVIDWNAFTLKADDRAKPQVNDPSGITLLTHFTNPRKGRLNWKPFATNHHDIPHKCARDCLTHPGSKCMSFNYDYGPSGTCELLEMIEGHDKLLHSGSFYHFERLGIGHFASFDYSHLALDHNKLLFFNMYLRNQLNYTHLLTGKGILVDKTPPHTGPISNNSVDVTNIEDCKSYTPSHLQQKCLEQTPLPNYRYIIDGPGSRTVFNGHTPLTDMSYTRANKMITANWDGFGDNETGILIYTWSVGTAPCAFNVHIHKDPHAHIPFQSEWTHIGIAYPLNLKDGRYHVTVRALNDIEFGGSMAVTVCHKHPYIIDTTDPVIHNITQAVYDELKKAILVYVNASDDLSGIKQTQIAFGRTKRDIYIMVWTNVTEFSNITFPTKLPDGIPVWVKIRVINHVDLRCAAHSPRPIFIDETAPIGGTIYISMGSKKGIHMPYQSETDVLCANWDGFHDPDSGISAFFFAIGTKAGLTDILKYVELLHNTHEYCARNLNLQHKHKYYVTITAENGATLVKNVTVSSSAVMIDTTPPVRGWVKDGLSVEPDIEFSSSTTTITANWGNFSDVESGLAHTNVIYYRQTHGLQHKEIIHTEYKLNKTATSYEKHHFHLKHQDTVSVTVEVTNNANLSTKAESNGYLVDLTKPEVVSLMDGHNVTNDQQYFASDKLSATWKFKDEESGLKQYEFSAYSLTGGTKKKIYPQTTSHVGVVLNPSTETYITPDPQSLAPGGLYFTRIAAINNAKLTAIHDTDGTILDSTPPNMKYIRAGVLTDEPENKIDGFVYHNDRSSITGNWRATDYESGIVDYFVGIGTSAGTDGVFKFTSFGKKEDGHLTKLSLQLTDKVTGQPVYYISVYAVNGAGRKSDIMSSSAIKIVEEDKEGTAWDGPGTTLEEDVDYQLDHTTISVQFSGFESELHGIMSYEWSIGTSPRLDDVKPYSEEGIIVLEDGKHIGIGSSGYGQLQVSLKPGIKYYSTIRAITGAGNILDSSSDGIIVDTTAPKVEITKTGVSDSVSSDTIIYQRSVDEIELNWDVKEDKKINSTFVLAGTYPDGENILSSQKLDKDSRSVPTGLIKPKENGIPNIIAVTVENELGLMTTVYSPPVVIDNSPPTAGNLDCQNIISGSSLSCKWENFKDEESGIVKFLVGFGDTEGNVNVVPFHTVSADQGSITFRKEHGLIVKHNKNYFVTLKAVNNVDMETTIYSSAIIVDSTPPSTGWIIELKDYTTWTLGTNPKFPSEFKPEMDVTCQRDLNRLAVAWEMFKDDDSGIVRYEIGVGSTPGGTQIHPLKQLSAEASHYVFTGLELYDVSQVFVLLKGYNQAGLYSSVISNGVFISRHSAGLNPIKPLFVNDGHGPFKQDIDFQNNRDTIAATWDFTGDPCPVVEYEWSVKRFDGKVILPMTKVPKGQTYVSADELELKDRESYFVIIKATNHLGYVTMLHSDGVTVKIEPLLPGIVRDGDIPGVDFKYQTSNNTISANWDGFGNERTDGSFDEAMYDQTEDIEVGDHQNILKYEVAVGTDRRYPGTRDNIHHFVNVGLNKTYTFKHLKLSSGDSMYYVTVRAHGVSTAMVEVTSNGIKMVNKSGLVSAGEINIPRYIKSTTSISFGYSEFTFLSPVVRYYWVIKQQSDVKGTVNCTDLLKEKQKPTSGKVLNDAGTDTYIKAEKLQLLQGTTYKLFVIAVDEAGVCGMAESLFTVDTTAPVEGNILVGPDLNTRVLYTESYDKLVVNWKNFKDDESGVKSFKIALFKGNGCSSLTKDNLPLVDNVHFPGNRTNYTFMDIAIKKENVYFVVLETENRAGLKIQTTSKPIVADFTSPIAGKVINGPNFVHDKKYQSSQHEVLGTILYTPPGNNEHCPFRDFNMKMMESHWTKIIHQGMWLLPNGTLNNVMFSDSQVIYVDNKTISLTLERDITKDQMISGAVMAQSDVHNGGTYDFDIKAATKLKAKTAITFWEGSAGILVDYETEIKKTTTKGIYTYGVPDPLYGDTFPAEYTSTRTTGTGFGFQIIPGSSGTEVILWSSDTKRTRFIKNTYQDIDWDQWQNFKFVINDEDEEVSMDDWVLKVFVKDKLMGELAGVKGVGPDSKILLGIYRPTLDVPVITDRFQTPTIASFIRINRFPPPSDALCRHGMPFQAPGHAIMQFNAGIGSEKGLVDIVNYQQVNKPCVPCVNKCDDLICDKQCSHNQVQILNITLKNVNLDPFEKEVNNVNGTKTLKSYYLTVKGITGSGRAAVSSSTGFYIDKTSPVIKAIYHTDPSWSSEQPIKYQGSNDSIAVYWEAYEDYSKITEYKWAIGTSPGKHNIQKFESTGTIPLASNNKLLGLLKDNTTYYVTVAAYNEAGVNVTNVSIGVTVLLTPPDVSGSAVVSPNTEPIQKTNRRKRSVSSSMSSNTVLTRYQDSVACAWDVLPSQKIDSVYASIGSTKGKGDIFSEIQVALNNSGVLSVSSRGAVINNDTIGNLSNFNTQQGSSHRSDFLMERGRTMVCNLRACNKGHVCSYMGTQNIIIIGYNDTVKTIDSDGHIFVNDTNANISIHTTTKQTLDTYLVYGKLSKTDLQQEYATSASSSFAPFIANPATTFFKTERTLLKRWETFTDISFYLAPLPDKQLSGPLQVSVDIGNNFDDGDLIVPKLLTWCPNEKMWIEATNSCDNTVYKSDINWNAKKLIVNICNVNRYCDQVTSETQAATRNKRQTTNNGLTNGNAFVVAGVNATLVNNPPFITSKTEYHIYEDPGTVHVELTATDPENDKFEFILDDGFSSNGTVNINESGHVYYKPCLDCTGKDVVHFKIVEIQSRQVPSLSVDEVLTFHITAVNDNPHVTLIQEGKSLEAIHNTVTLIVENNSPSQVPHTGLEILFSAFDVDGDSLKLYYEPPRYGKLKIEQQLETSEFFNVDCTLPRDNMSLIWNKELVKFYNYQTFVMPVPCNLNRTLPNNVNWFLSSANYMPRENFTGNDTVKVYAADKHGSPSYVLHIAVYILSNPCWNNATCYKPIHDETCTSTQRSQGFDGYYCNCSLGFTGTFCETNINECESNPCLDDYTCIDQIAQYKCECLSGNCGQSVPAWAIVIIVLILISIIVIASLCIWWNCCKKGSKNRVSCYPTADSKYLIGSRPASAASTTIGSVPPQHHSYSSGKKDHWAQPTPRAKNLRPNVYNKREKPTIDDTSSISSQVSNDEPDVTSRPETAVSRPKSSASVRPRTSSGHFTGPTDLVTKEDSDSDVSIFGTYDEDNIHTRQDIAYTPEPGKYNGRRGNPEEFPLSEFNNHGIEGYEATRDNKHAGQGSRKHIAYSPETTKRKVFKGPAKKKRPTQPHHQDPHAEQLKEMAEIYLRHNYNKHD